MKNHDDAFRIYINLGPTRSLKKVAERLDVNVRTVERWSIKENWQDRLDIELSR